MSYWFVLEQRNMAGTSATDLTLTWMERLTLVLIANSGNDEEEI